MKMNSLDWTAWVLVVMGALNWGLMGASGINLIETVVISESLTQGVYILIGLSGIYMLWVAVSKKK